MERLIVFCVELACNGSSVMHVRACRWPGGSSSGGYRRSESGTTASTATRPASPRASTWLLCG
jgi:hypothetical protein